MGMEFMTKRLSVGQISEKDIPALMELLTDNTVKHTYMVPDFSSLAEVETSARRLMDRSKDPERYMAGIFLQGDLIGIIHDVMQKEDTVEIGYALLPAYYNQGYCSEAFRGVIRWMWQQGFRKVIAGAFEENKASIRVMEKCGMTLQPETEMIDYRGRQHCCVYYAVTGEN